MAFVHQAGWSAPSGKIVKSLNDPETDELDLLIETVSQLAEQYEREMSRR